MGKSKKKKGDATMAPATTNEVHGALEFLDTAKVNDIRNTGRYREKPDDAKVDDMAHSISTQGQLTPIKVRKLPDGRFDPIYGFTRVAACRKLGKPVWAEVVECDPATAQAWSFTENVKRRDLLPIDIAYNCGQLLHQGWTQKHIAEVFGYVEGRVSQLLRYLQLPEKVRDAMADGKLVDRGALALCRLRKPEDKAVIDEDTVMAVFSAAKLIVESVPIDPDNPEGDKVITERYDSNAIERSVLKLVEPTPASGPETPAGATSQHDATVEAGKAETGPAATHESTAKVTLNQIHRTIKRVMDNATLSQRERMTLNSIVEFIEGKSGTLEFEDDLAQSLETEVSALFPDRKNDTPDTENAEAGKARRKRGQKKVAAEATA